MFALLQNTFVHLLILFPCLRFDDQESVAARDAQKKQRDTLDRYLFYYNRCVNRSALKFFFRTITSQSLLFPNASF